MPSATEVIKLMLDEEVMYRILSAVAHGHNWAIRWPELQACARRRSQARRWRGTGYYVREDS